jgi:hypothetical protein
LIEFAASEKSNHQRATLPLLFSPSKEGAKNPTTALWLQPVGLLALEIHGNITMKTRQRENNFRRTLRKILRPQRSRHNPMLAVNMSVFNFTDGWSRTFSKNEYARFYA